MQLKIKLVDKTLPKPEYQTKGAVAFDLYSRVDIAIPPWEQTVIPSNVIVKIPKGYFLMIASRSSTAKKFGFILANGIGIIDQDYCGEEDEVGVAALNFTGHKIHIKRGDRIAQAVLVKIAIPQTVKIVDKMSSKSRGGWGSTGHHHTKKTR